MSEGLFPGEEEKESSADDLTTSVTSDTSDLLRLPKGVANTFNTHLHLNLRHLHLFQLLLPGEFETDGVLFKCGNRETFIGISLLP